MNWISRAAPFAAAVALAVFPVRPAQAQDAAAITADIALTRTAADRWQVQYTFSTPVTGIDFGRPVVAYRDSAWRVLTPGARMSKNTAGGDVVAADSPVTRLVIDVMRYTAFAHDMYAPMVPFTDGGAALYVGFFTGDALLDGRAVPVDYTFAFHGRAGEQVLAGTGANSYVYYGPATPVASSDMRLIIDPGAPAWIVDAMSAAVVPAARVFSESLGVDLPAPPLVLMGAGDLESADGASVKGGAIGDQFVMLMTGRGLLTENPRMRAALEKLAVHELAHLWQLATMLGAFHETEPWLHEGAAEAMAVHALVAAGRWTAADAATFGTQAAERCAKALGGAPADATSLAAAVAAGNGDVAYACGFGLYWRPGADALRTWAQFADVVRGGERYTHATLERVLAARAGYIGGRR